jgi:hypothetical protein
VCGLWDGQRDRVHVFEMRLDRLPQLQLDNREIVDARLASVSEMSSLALTGPVTAYLRYKLPASATGGGANSGKGSTA